MFWRPGGNLGGGDQHFRGGVTKQDKTRGQTRMFLASFGEEQIWGGTKCLFAAEINFEGGRSNVFEPGPKFGEEARIWRGA